MKNKVIAVMAAGILACALAGCGASGGPVDISAQDESGEVPVEEDPQEKYTGELPETTDGILDESMFTTIGVGGTEYTVPLDYAALQGLGYAADTEESASGYLTLRSGDYPYCAIDAGTGSSEVTEEMLMEEGVSQLSFAASYDEVYPDITFHGVGLGDSADSLLAEYGQPNECSSVGYADIEASYTYTREDGNASYSLTFYIDTDGEVAQIDYICQ